MLTNSLRFNLIIKTKISISYPEVRDKLSSLEFRKLWLVIRLVLVLYLGLISRAYPIPRIETQKVTEGGKRYTNCTNGTW